tara:strand:+ start:1022 stop:2026 length:1005 start_codon:yes stop_codon:yes gene_type:complete
MNLKERISVFVKLGEYLKNEIHEQDSEQLHLAEIKNPWFTKENITHSLNAWYEQLNEETISSWLNPYKLGEVKQQKKVLIVMAGNIPLVGFHDFLTVLICGHKVVVKMSSNDSVLLKILISKLISITPYFKQQIEFIDDIRKRKFDAVIATGSDSSAKHFNYYFKDCKRIIRNSRRSIAILDGSENAEELEGLASDVFAYFGLGCRNISKLFLPIGFDLDILFKVFYEYAYLLEHKKYANNYDYNKSILLMGNNEIVENGFLLLKEDRSMFSPVAMLYYEFYDDRSVVDAFIKENADKLQCIVSRQDLPFGSTQTPHLWDYADGIDTVAFLKKL